MLPFQAMLILGRVLQDMEDVRFVEYALALA